MLDGVTQNETPAAVPPEEYQVVAELFDRAYYLRKYPDVDAAGVDPITHYLKYGAREGRNPSPDFDTSYYLKRHPDVAANGINPFYHYLIFGRKEGRATSFFSPGEPIFDAMCEMVGRTPEEVSDNLDSRRRSLRARLATGNLGEMVRKAGELEPLIHQTWLAAHDVRLPPFRSEKMAAEIVSMHRLQKLAELRRARFVIVLRALSRGGVQRIAGHLAQALSSGYGAEDVVVLATDESACQCRHWFPPGCRVLDFAAVADANEVRDRHLLIVEFIRSLRPEVVFNMNSALLWGAMRDYGPALSNSSAIVAYLFCNDVDRNGHSVGYPNRNFYRYYDQFAAVVTDSMFLAHDLRSRFLPPAPDKIVVLNTPVDVTAPLVTAPAKTPERRPKIFWAGRFVRQKRLDIVARIAEKLPQVDFCVWGGSALDAQGIVLPKNIAVLGAYNNFSDLPLGECDLWLYTSQWDGVPNMIFEVAATGIPIVSSTAGGCGEILVEGLCERIEDVEDIDAFVGAVHRVLDDPAAARSRANRLRDWVMNERAPSAYRAAVTNLIAKLTR